MTKSRQKTTPMSQAVWPEYDIVMDGGLENLIYAVNDKIREGWMVIGSICWTGEHYLQPIIFVPRQIQQPQQLPVQPSQRPQMTVQRRGQQD